jgi:hypothetical protein
MFVVPIDDIPPATAETVVLVFETVFPVIVELLISIVAVVEFPIIPAPVELAASGLPAVLSETVQLLSVKEAPAVVPETAIPPPLVKSSFSVTTVLFKVAVGAAVSTRIPAPKVEPVYLPYRMVISLSSIANEARR